MLPSASKGARVAAGIVCAVFVAFVLIHLLWAIGITWGLDEVSGRQADDPELTASLYLTAISLAAAAVGVAVIVVTLARVGWLKTRLSDRMLHIGSWLVFAWPAIGTLNPNATWGQRAVALPLAIAALAVARARPQRHAAERPRPPITRAPVAR